MPGARSGSAGTHGRHGSGACASASALGCQRLGAHRTSSGCPKNNLIKPRSAGAHLDPRRVLDALDPEMPLALAADTLAAMMRTALHRRRAGALSRSLHRACHLSAAAERAEVCAGHRLSPTEERGVARLPPARLCRACHLLRACSQRCSPSWDQLGQGQWGVLTLELSACATRPEGAR